MAIYPKPIMVRLTLSFTILFVQGLLGHAQAPAYTGWRLSLHQFADLRASKDAYTFTCNVVNTGREAVTIAKGKSAPEQLVCEVDTFALPADIKSRRDDICASIFQAKIELAPGATQQKVRLSIPFVASNAEMIAQAETKPSATTKPAAKPKAPEPDFQPESETYCPDLRFDTAYVVDQTKSTVTVRYVLRNVGGSTARLLGSTDAEGDNIAVNVYFNRATRLTRGAMLGDGTYLREGKETQTGLLFPDARLYGEITVSREHHTKMAPNIILEVDPFTSLVECDKTNNTFVVRMELE
jgi:hypothetical protein